MFGSICGNAPALGYAPNGMVTLDYLIQTGALTFYKDYSGLSTGTVTNAQLNADFSNGSATATFTATRSASAPATYIDDSGVIQLVTTSDVGRIRGGYYDTTGFHAQKGLMIEGAGTNLLRDSYFSILGGTYWNATASAGGTAALTASTLYSNIYSGATQIAKFVGTKTDDRFRSNSGPDGFTVTAGTKYTVSFIARGTGNIKIRFYDGTATTLSDTITLCDSWCKQSYTFTPENSTANSGVIAIGLSEDNNVTMYMSNIQLEASPYATSFIPTTTAALTRNAETLKYAIAGNRTAASESIFVKFSPMGSFANDGVARVLLYSDDKVRVLRKATTSDKMKFFPNISDSNTCDPITTTIAANGTSYVVSGVAYGETVDVNAAIFINGTSEGTDTADYTAPAWGTYFNVGSDNRVTPAQHANCVFQSLVFFSDAKGETDVAAITNLLNS